ncbi:MAG: hypothetical protein AAGA20_12660 [Planctomycetota bacterium]
MTESSETADQVERGGRRWLRRLLGGVLGLVVIALVAGPPLAGRWLRGEVERRAGNYVNGSVELERLSLALNGKAVLTGLTVKDRAGDVVASIPRARLDVGLRSLLTGKKDVALLVEGAQIDLARGEDGTWNVAELPRDVPRAEPPRREGDPGGGGAPRPPAPSSPPDVHGRLEIVDSTVVVRSPETALELRDVHFTIGLDGGDEDTAVRLDASVFGGEGSVGDLHADVSIWPEAGPGLRLVDVSARGVDLGMVAEALRLVGSPLEEGSELAGSVDVVVRGELADLSPDAAFTLEVDGSATALVMALANEGDELFRIDPTDGSVQLRAARDGVGSEPRASATLLAKDGKLAAAVTWDGAAERGLVVELDVDALDASAGLEPYLERVHPAFATANALEGASLGGLVTSHVTIEYDAPLPLATLTGGGLAELPTEPFRGTGSLSVDEGLVRTSPFVSELLEAFGEPANPTFDLKPLGFAVDAGKISYTNPWTWTIEGTETRFVGSVGLDRTLDLKWVVPVTGGLAQQNRVFRTLEGETLEVGLGGTLTSPDLRIADVLSSFVETLTESKIEDEIRRGLEDLGGGDAATDALQDILGGGDPAKALENAASGILGSDADAATLLKEADRLWNAGKRQEAAQVYRRIRKEFPLSPTYLINKSRIKGRRNG